MKVGFKYALENNYSHVITLDGDMQHDPMEINQFIDYDENIDNCIVKPQPRTLRGEVPLADQLCLVAQSPRIRGSVSVSASDWLEFEKYPVL